MKLSIRLVTPAAARTRYGNRVTALRWARRLRELGHRVVIEMAYEGGKCDVLLALHARRSYPSVARYRELRPDGPLIVALTGTDLYGDIRHDAGAQASLELASRLVLLQPLGIEELPQHVRGKTRTIFQSAERPKGKIVPARDAFEVCVMGHLRDVKDPFRTALASRLLPPSSRLRVLHLGGALDEAMATVAREEMEANPRYRWLDEVPRARALRTMARCRLLVLTSKLEGGANVVTEALAAGVPVLSTRIAGSLGILGTDYPGYFPVGDTEALAVLLERAETDQGFYRELRERCRKLRALVSPGRERRSWASLLREIIAE
ncbi:MAG: selenoneine biosynthesis selenosugar synthase SenB [Acidobacteriota bacterium]